MIRRTSVPKRHFRLSRVVRVTPWYELEITEEQKAPEVPLPALPQNPPEILPRLLHFLTRDMALRDLEVIDGRSKNTALGPALLVVGTGASSKHLAAAGSFLMKWLKHNCRVVADYEGLFTSNYIRINSKRARRKAAKQRNARNALPHFIKADSWVSVDTHCDNIYVHVLTADRREAVDFSSLFNEEPLAEGAEAREEYRPPARVPSGRREMHTVADRRPASLSMAPSESRSAYIQALERQASGDVLSDAQIENVLREICYAGQSVFSSLSAFDPVSRDRWASVCETKAAIILRFYGEVLRPQGRSLLLEPRWVLLLYRTFCCPSKESVSVAEALDAPYPVSSLGMFHNFRSPPFRLILEKQNALFNTEALMLILQTLANGHTWDTFWRLLDLVTTTSVVDARIIEASLALIVRSGAERQLNHALISFLPNLLLREGLALTPSMARTLRSGLAVCDPEKKNFGSLRDLVNDALPST